MNPYTERRISAPGLIVLAIALAMLTSSALAQEDEVDEIIIYGERTEKTLQDTAASVAVITADVINEKNIENFRDAFRLFGNVIDADWVDAGFVIRGVNSEGLTPGGSPLAAVYVDGAQQTVQGARRGARGLWDIQQVEIYRGPQSTLSGRAALAGAIYIRSKDPTFEWDFASRLTGGTDETAEGAIAFGGPISNSVAFRIAAEYQSRENDLAYPGFEQYVRFDDFIEDEYYQVRGKLLANFGDVETLLSYSFSHDSPIYRDIAGPGLGFEYAEQRGDFNLPFFQDTREADNSTLSLQIQSPFGDALTFTSLTTFNDTDLEKPSINQGTPGEVFTSFGTDDQQLLTQEFRLNSTPSETGRQWVAGLYFQDESQDSNNRRSVFFGGGREDFSLSKSALTNFAIFGEIVWPLSELWALTLGGRIDYTDTTADLFFARDNFDPGFPDTETTGSSSNDETNFLPKVGIERSLGDDRSIALTVQRGFRIGGAGIDGSDGSPFEFDAEYTWNYEVAYRSRILDGRGTLNANVFYTDWDDQQVEVQLVPGDFTSTVTLNAGKSNLYGAEIESSFSFSDEVSGFASVGFVETEFDEFVSSIGDFSGLEFPEAPNLTLAAGIDWRSASGIFAGVDAKYVDEYLARDLQNTPVDVVGDYTVANVQIGYRTGNWTVTLFSDNVFDEEYFVYRDVLGDSDCCATLGTQRVSGITVSYGL